MIPKHEDILAKLEKIEELLHAIFKSQLAPVLEKELGDQKMADLYEFTGTMSQSELKKKLKCSPNTITDAWKRWEQLGLLVKKGKQYRKVL